MRHIVSVLSLVVVSLFPMVTRADVEPRPTCQVEGLGCKECTRSVFDDTPEEQAPYNSCRDANLAAGLVMACADGSGPTSVEYYCAPGVEVEKTTDGCNYSVQGSAKGAGMISFLAAIGIAWARRRRNIK